MPDSPLLAVGTGVGYITAAKVNILGAVWYENVRPRADIEACAVADICLESEGRKPLEFNKFRTIAVVWPFRKSINEKAPDSDCT